MGRRPLQYHAALHQAGGTLLQIFFFFAVSEFFSIMSITMSCGKEGAWNNTLFQDNIEQFIFTSYVLQLFTAYIIIDYITSTPRYFCVVPIVSKFIVTVPNLPLTFNKHHSQHEETAPATSLPLHSHYQGKRSCREYGRCRLGEGGLGSSGPTGSPCPRCCRTSGAPSARCRRCGTGKCSRRVPAFDTCVQEGEARGVMLGKRENNELDYPLHVKR